MRVDGVPNVRTCELPVREGMIVERQDAGAFYAKPMQMILSEGHAFFPVGFYYKWFTRPPAISRFFLDRIRPLTGIGRLPGAPNSLRPLPASLPQEDSPSRQAHDLGRYGTVIVGAGPSGLEAAVQATGRVLILDDHDQPGGQRHGALKHMAALPGGSLERFPILRSHLERIDKAREQFSSGGEVQFLAGARAIAGYAPDGLLLRRGDHLQTVSFDALVWAAGALDTLGLFPGNDCPGVIGPRALYRLVIRDGLDLKGQQVLIIGGGLDLWLSAALLDARGANLSLVVTDNGIPAELPVAVDRNWQLNTGLTLDRISTRNQDCLRARFTPVASGDNPTGSHLTLDAHLVVICNRGKPAYDIPYQLGADLALQPDLGGFAPARPPESDPGQVDNRLPGGRSLITTGEAAGLVPGLSAFSAGEVQNR
jgi:sarcosine oxidase subunit alpha